MCQHLIQHDIPDSRNFSGIPTCVEWAYRKHVNPARIAGSVRVDDRRDLMAQMALDPEFIRVGDAPVRQEVAAAPIQGAGRQRGKPRRLSG
jgi:hypothetical protein